ncbi:hypothetical protein ACFPOB_26245 [Bosea eneae]|uniref:Major tropism determinant N-terminal domain-containing protein n=1 Tax=Bosea eneae TaxID=151454 RepID=A0ABW0J1W7_9HYPH
MAVQVQHRRGTAAAHATFIGAPGEYTWEEDTKRVVGHDGATAGGIKMARLDEVTSEVLRAVGNANFSFQSTDRLVVPNAAFTAARTGTLPLASSVAPGRTISFIDNFPAISGANVLNIARSGADTINGATALSFAVPRGRLDMVSDGVSKWSATFHLADGDRGDITVSAGGSMLTIDDDVVTNGKLANMAAATMKGRALGAGVGDPVDLTPAQVRAIVGQGWTTIFDQTVIGAAVYGFIVPLGSYSLYRFRLFVAPNPAMDSFQAIWRSSRDGGGTYDSGGSDYNSSYQAQVGAAVSGEDFVAGSFGLLSTTIAAAAARNAIIEGLFERGANGVSFPRMGAISYQHTGTAAAIAMLNSERASGPAATNLLLATTVAAAFAAGSSLIVEAR